MSSDITSPSPTKVVTLRPDPIQGPRDVGNAYLSMNQCHGPVTKSRLKVHTLPQYRRIQAVLCTTRGKSNQMNLSRGSNTIHGRGSNTNPTPRHSVTCRHDLFPHSIECITPQCTYNLVQVYLQHRPISFSPSSLMPMVISRPNYGPKQTPPWSTDRIQFLKLISVRHPHNELFALSSLTLHVMISKTPAYYDNLKDCRRCQKWTPSQ